MSVEAHGSGGPGRGARDRTRASSSAEDRRGLGRRPLRRFAGSVTIPRSVPTLEVPDAGRVDDATGVEGRVRRVGAGRGLGSDGRALGAGGGARVRVAVGLRSLPHGPAPDRGDHVRVVLRPVRDRDGDRARAPRPHGRVHRVPEPGPDREALVDDRRHQRRPVRARDRRRLEGRRVAGVRLRLPDDRGADGRVRRPPRGHHRDVRGRAGRATRASTPTSAAPSTSRRASSHRGSRSSSAATGRR